MDRHGRKGSALALRNWRVPWRLIALIAIPTLVAMAFAGLRVGAAADSAGMMLVTARVLTVKFQTQLPDLTDGRGVLQPTFVPQVV